MHDAFGLAAGFQEGVAQQEHLHQSAEHARAQAAGKPLGEFHRGGADQQRPPLGVEAQDFAHHGAEFGFFGAVDDVVVVFPFVVKRLFFGVVGAGVVGIAVAFLIRGL